MSDEQSCEHGQLYAHLTVTFAVPIEHNSVLCVRTAKADLYERLRKIQIPASYRIADVTTVSEDSRAREIPIEPLKDPEAA